MPSNGQRVTVFVCHKRSGFTATKVQRIKPIVCPMGFEPMTFSLKGRCATNCAMGTALLLLRSMERNRKNHRRSTYHARQFHRFLRFYNMYTLIAIHAYISLKTVYLLPERNGRDLNPRPVRVPVFKTGVISRSTTVAHSGQFRT